MYKLKRSIKFAYLDWLTCKKYLLGGHGKARRTVNVFHARKTKRISKFDGLEPRRCEDIKRIVTPEIGPKKFGTYEKQVPEAGCSKPD